MRNFRITIIPTILIGIVSAVIVGNIMIINMYGNNEYINNGVDNNEYNEYRDDKEIMYSFLFHKYTVVYVPSPSTPKGLPE